MRLAHDSPDSHALATGEAAGKSQNFLRVPAGGCRARVHTQVGLRPRHPGGKTAALPFSPESRAAPASRTSTDRWVVGESETARTLGVATVPPPCPTSLDWGLPMAGPGQSSWLIPCLQPEAPRAGARKDSTSVQLPNGSAGCSQWGLCGLSEAGCQARQAGFPPRWWWGEAPGQREEKGRHPSPDPGPGLGRQELPKLPRFGGGRASPNRIPLKRLTQRPAVRAAAARAACGRSAGLGRGGPRLPRPNPPVMAQGETAPTSPSPALPLPSPEPSAETRRLPPALHARTSQ